MDIQEQFAQKTLSKINPKITLRHIIKMLKDKERTLKEAREKQLLR